MRAPISVYVVWHPACTAARTLAGEIFAWFRRSAGELMPQKVGLPVHYRSRLENGALDAPVNWSGADANWVVLLVDENMVIDREWRATVARLFEEASRSSRIKLFPVALHPSAARVHAPLGEQQFIVLTGASESTGDRSVVLRRLLTQAFAREGRRQVRLGQAETPLRVFISHAKLDGRKIADECRVAIYRYGQIEAFFDEHELAWGEGWRRTLEEGVRSQSVALLAIETDAYASRPWCRRELALARQPVRLAGDGDQTGVDRRVWRVLPTVLVVDAGPNWSKVLAETGNVPRIGWASDRIDHILDKLLLEALLADAHTLLARRIATKHSRAHVITWVPDVQSILAVTGALGGTQDRRTLFYPGHGLTVQERKSVQERLRFVELKTFEEAQ